MRFFDNLLQFLDVNIVTLCTTAVLLAVIGLLCVIVVTPSEWNWTVIDGELCFTISESQMDYSGFSSEGLYCKVKRVGR